MTGRTAVRLAWWSMVVLFAGGVLLGALSTGHLGLRALILVPFTAYGVVGALVAARRPENPVGWVFLSVGALIGLFSLADELTRLATAQGAPYPWWAVAAAWMQAWLWYPLLGLATVFTVLLYPSGLASRRWRPVLWLAVGCVGLVVLCAAVAPMLEMGDPTRLIRNPLAADWLPPSMQGQDSAVFGIASILGLGVCGMAAVVSAVLRYRRSRGVERLQMRWFAFSAVALAVTVGVFFNSTEPIAGVAGDVALAFVPVSCGLAILRYRLYDIDRIISRTASYALVTGAVVLVYAAVVTTVPRLLPVSSSFAVAVATLAAAAAARPLLFRARRVVDRRFNREHFDAERTVEAFGVRLRDEVDPAQVVDDLVVVARGTMQPTAVVVWLRGSA